MLLYVGETMLREITLEVLRMHVPSVTDIKIVMRRGPFVPGNWRIEWINVPVEDYGPARDKADGLEAANSWIMVPDEHPLAGQVFGKEEPREWAPP